MCEEIYLERLGAAQVISVPCPKKRKLGQLNVAEVQKMQREDAGVGESFVSREMPDRSWLEGK